ncbi:TniB family NTP-binding protein [Embleya sp. NBC_00896]|uniref:TniB family NTP-binding protein n=1 Tax=Embleya sp. NBC_00896 TaxID=2975961 RepID=UPI002F90E678
MVSPDANSGDHTWGVGADTTEQSRPVTTWQGWQDFATAPPPTPPEPGTPPRNREERPAYHSAFVTVRTPAIDALATSVRTLMILGRHQRTTARPSLIVTGPAAAGKTTALLHVGRACHLAHIRNRPPPPGTAHARVPVAYVLVPPGATPKALATEFARYLGVPVTTRMTQAQITEAVCHTYDRVGVRLVLIDENPPPQPPHHHRRRNRRPAERPHRTHRGDVRVRGHRRGRHTVVRWCARGATRRTGLADRVRGVPGTTRETRTLHRADRRSGSRPRLGTHTAPGHSPASRPTPTNAPPAGSAASPASPAKPRSPPSWTAPNASPKPASTRFGRGQSGSPRELFSLSSRELPDRPSAPSTARSWPTGSQKSCSRQRQKHW